MISLFSTPKAFEGHIGLIQHNTMANWQLFGYETFLFCNDPGVKQAAMKYGVNHVPEVARTEMGTPIIGEIFRDVQTKASHDLIMYANTDIIFVRGLDEVLNYVNNTFDRVLVTGSRHNLDVEREIKYTGNWSYQLEEEARTQGVPHPGTGIDYFIFRKGMFTDMPKFALGRGYWDTWLVASALSHKSPVIDATEVVFVVHQNHDYMHLPESAEKRGKRKKWYSKGPETAENSILRGDMIKSCRDATYKLSLDPFTGSITHF